MKSFIKKEKFKYIIVFTTLICIMLPYVIGYLRTPENYTFTGFIYNTVDNFTYLSKMQNARHGWSFINNYTDGVTDGGYNFIFYIILGKLALLFNVPNIYIFHLSRIILTIIFIYLLYDLLKYIEIKNKYYKDLIVIICIFSGTIYWMIDIFQIVTRGYVSNGYFFEPYPFMNMLSTPHYLWVNVLQICVLKYTLIYFKNRLKYSFYISFILLLICIVHSYTGVLSGISAGTYILYKDIRLKQFNLKNFFKLLIFSLCSLPYLVYSLYIFSHNDMLIGWQRQAITMLGGFQSRIISIGVIYILFIMFLFLKCTWNSNRDILIWFCILPMFLIHMPIYFQNRLLEGTGIYLFILLGIYLCENYTVIKKANLYLIIFLFTFNSFWFSIEPLFLEKRIGYMYINKDMTEMYSYIIEKINTDEKIISDIYNGLLIPAYTDRRVVLGHHHESIDFATWRNEYEKVALTGDMRYMISKGIDYYIYNKNLYNSEIFGDYTIVFENNNFKIYKLY